jgi:hypothetical protein
MEKYYKASEVQAILKKLAKEPYYQHQDEDFYAGICAFDGELMSLDTIEADIDELKKEVADLNNRRHLIWALGVDYDGCNTVESLKELIDELVSYTQLPREQVPDITSRTSKWQFKKYVGEEYYFCASCDTEYKLPDTWSRYDVGCYCKYCSNCGAKMEVDA